MGGPYHRQNTREACFEDPDVQKTHQDLGSGSTGPTGPTGLLHGLNGPRRAREAVALNEPIIPSGAGVTLYVQLGRSTTVLGI